jgi:succinyl-diaminopimelate desuccinylase
MKSGNVVAMRLFEDAALRERSPYDLALVLYAGEEGPAAGNELAEVLAQVPWLADAALAIVLEPTDGRIELGCLGGLHAEVTLHGVAAHSGSTMAGTQRTDGGRTAAGRARRARTGGGRRRRHRVP